MSTIVRGGAMVKVRLERQTETLTSVPQLDFQNNQKPCKSLSRGGDRRMYHQICKSERPLWMPGAMS